MDPLLRADLRLWLVLVGLAAPVASQDFAELGGAGLPRDLHPMFRFVAVDVDGDQDLDLVLAPDDAFPGGPLQLYENDGDGDFARAGPGRIPARVTVAGDLVAGDVDGDGDQDLVVAGRDLQPDLLFLNDGTGTFTDATAAALPTAQTDARAVALADLDGDGDLDLVFADAGAPDRVLANDGRGVFSLSATLPAGPFDRPSAVVVLDADLDGVPEILVAEVLDPDRYWVRDPSGAWIDLAAERLPGPASMVTALAVFDADGDGDPDLAVGFHDQTDLLLRNDGFGKFTSEALLASSSSAAGSTSAFATADLDLDGDLDLVATELGGVDKLLWNDGTGVFGLAGPGWLGESVGATVDVLAADLDGDGDSDLVTIESAGLAAPSRKHLWRNDGRGAMRSETAVGFDAPNLSTTDLAVGDFDGDRSLDLFVGRPGLADELWFGDGNGVLKLFPIRALESVADGTAAVAAGDVDGDGDLDLVAIGPSAQHLFRNDGARAFTEIGAGNLPSDSADVKDLVLADFDGDGDLDAYVAHAGPSPAFADLDSLWLNDGTGRFVDQSARLPAIARLGHSIATGDVDGDGDLDVLVGNRTVLPGLLPDQPDLLLLNDGTANFVAATPTQYPSDREPTTGVALVDVDADGDLDAVTVGARAPARLLRNDGQGNFTLVPTAMPPDLLLAICLVAVDRDLDGDLDLVVGQRDAINRVLVNDGQGNFTLAPVDALPNMPSATTSLVSADFDGDGDGDLVVGNDRSQKDFLLVNLHRQVSAPTRARIGADYELVIHAGQPGAVRVAAVWMGFAVLPTGIPVGGLGLFWLDPSLTFRAGNVTIASSEREVRVIGRLPNSPSAVGFPFHVQAMVFPGVDPFAGGFTQLVSETIGR